MSLRTTSTLIGRILELLVITTLPSCLILGPMEFLALPWTPTSCDTRPAGLLIRAISPHLSPRAA